VFGAKLVFPRLVEGIVVGFPAMVGAPLATGRAEGKSVGRVVVAIIVGIEEDECGEEVGCVEGVMVGNDGWA
jgi:hypothetical protein